MAKKAIGPTFGDEVHAAGLDGLPFAWGANGAITFGAAMTDKQKAAVLAVYAAHDPAAAVKPKSALDRLDGMLDAHGLTMDDLKRELAK